MNPLKPLIIYMPLLILSFWRISWLWTYEMTLSESIDLSMSALFSPVQTLQDLRPTSYYLAATWGLSTGDATDWIWRILYTKCLLCHWVKGSCHQKCSYEATCYCKGRLLVPPSQTCEVAAVLWIYLSTSTSIPQWKQNQTWALRSAMEA